MKRCFFIGHREAPSEILPTLAETIECCIVEHGVGEFIVGSYGGFDRMAIHAVIAAKKTHPEVLLSILLPYHPAERTIDIPNGVDSTIYPPGMEKVPRRFAIVRANRYAVDHADFLIAYVWHPASNACKLLEYAEKRAEKGCLKIRNLGLTDKFNRSAPEFRI